MEEKIICVNKETGIYKFYGWHGDNQVGGANEITINTSTISFESVQERENNRSYVVLVTKKYPFGSFAYTLDVPIQSLLDFINALLYPIEDKIKLTREDNSEPNEKNTVRSPFYFDEQMFNTMDIVDQQQVSLVIKQIYEYTLDIINLAHNLKENKV